MLHPSYKELMEKMNAQADTEEGKITSRYTLVTATSRRARQIADVARAEQIVREKIAKNNPNLTENVTVTGSNYRNLSLAVAEMEDGEVKLVKEPLKNNE